MLGELAFLHLDLAPSADAAPTADALYVDAQRARRIEHRRAERKPPPPARGHEEDKGIFEGDIHFGWPAAPTWTTAAARPPPPCGEGLGEG